MTPETLREDYGHLLVRRAIDRDDDVSQAIFDMAAGDRRHWSRRDWHALLSQLARSQDTIARWLDKFK